MIHYHGTPVTPHAQFLKMSGRHFCVSHADPRDTETCLHIGQSVMFDNGAFSAWTRGRPLDAAAVAEWVLPHLRHPHWVVVPDVIDGTVAEQDALLRAWRLPKALSAPVWHLGLPLSYLGALVDAGYGRICFGSSGDFRKLGTDEWRRRVDEAFDFLAKTYRVMPWVHMLRAMSLASGGPWPFASADSTNVARNHKTAGKCPEEMAKRIDSVNPVVLPTMKNGEGESL